MTSSTTVFPCSLRLQAMFLKLQFTIHDSRLLKTSHARWTTLPSHFNQSCSYFRTTSHAEEAILCGCAEQQASAPASPSRDRYARCPRRRRALNEGSF
eukprot:4371001-Amphidinium_carterae.3